MRQKSKLVTKITGEQVFFTSDTHFNHICILRFCNRPFKDIQEMNQSLIENWNRVVGKDDLVFHLGDFAFGNAAAWNQILDQLNGKIILIVGNHDMKNMRQAVVERFEEFALEMYIEIDKQPIILNHHPFLCYGGSYDNIWQLFGHVHTRQNYFGRDKDRLSVLFPTQYDVGIDNNNYAPISFEQVKQIINQQILQNNEDSIHE